jgi:predicted dehydrogenase
MDPAVAAQLVEVLARGKLAALVFTTNRFRPNIETFLTEAVATGGWAGAQATALNAIDEPGNPYGASPWRQDKGGLWDVGPHVLSVLVPVLGPIAEVTARAGRYDIVQLTLRHRDGALSTAAVGIHVPAAMTESSTIFYGPAGRRTVPAPDTDSVTAYRVAIARLAANVAAGVTADPLDARAGRDAVAVLAAAETSMARGTTITL